MPHHSSRRIPVLLLKRQNGSGRKVAANRGNALQSTGPRPSEGKRPATQRPEGRAACSDIGGKFAETIAQAACTRWRGSKKRVSNFDERSHYVIENKRSGKRTKPNKADCVGGKTVRCSGGLRLPPRAGDRRIRFGRGALRAPDDAGAGTAPIPKHECRPRSAGSELHLSLFARRGGGTAQEQPGCHRDPVLESMASPTALSLAEGQTGL